MLRYAVIGTSGIARQFVDAAAAQGDWSLVGVLGSTASRGREFCLSTGSPSAASYQNITGLLDDGPDVVYVASPNGLHLAAACAIIGRGTHVVVEKPAFTTAAEWETAHELADKSGVLLLEAARHIYEDNYLALRSAVARLGAVTGAALAFRQYSSRWPAYLAGEHPRVFSAADSGGALVDLGVYQLYAAIDWFGVPDDVSYQARLLETGADAAGVAVLGYAGFDVTVAVSKVHATGQRNEVYGPDGEVLAFNNVAGVAWLRQESPSRRRELPLQPLDSNPLAPEVRHLARRLMAHPHEPADAPYTYAQLTGWGHEVIRLSDRLRRSAGIEFPADRTSD